MSYEYDIFLSYPRGGGAERFVRGALHPMLVDSLREVAGPLRAPKPVFLAEEMRRGPGLKQSLTEALDRSAVMLMVWTGTYPFKEWCLGEWQAMKEREIFFAAQGARPSLIYPLVVAAPGLLDEEPDPPVYRRFMDHYTVHCNAAGDHGSHACRRDVVQLCHELAVAVRLAPDWVDGLPKLSVGPRPEHFPNPSSL